jgi:hypothetical protein
VLGDDIVKFHRDYEHIVFRVIVIGSYGVLVSYYVKVHSMFGVDYIKGHGG